MAQQEYCIEYIGAVKVKKNTPLLSADILTSFPAASVLKIKSIGILVSVDNTVMYPIDYNDENYLVTGHTYTFSDDCIIAVGIYKAVS